MGDTLPLYKVGTEKEGKVYLELTCAEITHNENERKVKYYSKFISNDENHEVKIIELEKGNLQKVEIGEFDWFKIKNE